MILLLFSIRSAYLGVAFILSLGNIERHHLESSLYILVIWGALCALSARVEAPTCSQTAPDNHWRTLGSVAAYVIVGCALYHRALWLGLLSDDFVLLSRADQSVFFSPDRQQFVRPLPMVLWHFLARWQDQAPALMHLTNVVLHSLNAYLVSRLGRRLGLDRLTATTAGALFLSFPTAVEAVAWCSGIFDVLMTSFALAFVLSINSRHSLWLRVSLATTFTVLALATKETAVVLPLFGALVWWRRVGPRFPITTLGLPLFACVVYGVWRIYAYQMPDGYSVQASWYVFKELPSRLFGTLGMPFHQRVIADAAWLVVVLFLLTLFLLTWSFWRWRIDKLAFRRAIIAGAWGLLSIVPVYGFFFVGADLQGARFVYLATTLWVVLYADMIYHGVPAIALGRRSAVVLSATLFSLFAATVTVHLQPWGRASSLRDRVLNSAVQVVRAESGPVVFEDLPDSVEGAYVFRNGFPEALARNLGRMDTGGARVPVKTWRWDGRSFRRLE